jgi:hypothetical protein
VNRIRGLLEMDPEDRAVLTGKAETARQAILVGTAPRKTTERSQTVSTAAFHSERRGRAMRRDTPTLLSLNSSGTIPAALDGVAAHGRMLPADLHSAVSVMTRFSAQAMGNGFQK